MIWALIDLVGPALIGALLIHRLVGSRPGAPSPWLSLALGAPLGLGLFSLVFFLAYIAGLPLWLWRWLDAGAMLLGLFLVWRLVVSRRRVFAAAPSTPAVAQEEAAWCGPLAGRLVTVALDMAGLAALSVLVLRIQFSPHGDWDAWAIWNLRARFLFRDPSRAFIFLDKALLWTHPDYPLNLPLLVLRGWIRGDEESTAVPAMLAGAFFLAQAGLLLVAQDPSRRGITPRLAAMTLLATPTAPLLAGGQLADVPLASYLLICTVCCHWALLKEEPRFLLLAGFAASCAAWTKNEGLYMHMALAGFSLLPLVRGRAADALGRAGWIGAGALPGDLILFLFWSRVGGYSGEMRSLLAGDQIWSNLLSLERHSTVAGRFLMELFDLKAWAGGPLLALLYPLLLGLDPSAKARRSVAACAFLLILLLAMQYLTFVIIPGDLTWYLNSALGRLLLHSWPALVFLIFTAGRPILIKNPALPASPAH